MHRVMKGSGTTVDSKTGQVDMQCNDGAVRQTGQYDPEGDYGRGNLPAGIFIGGPGIASYDPEGDGMSGISTAQHLPGVRNPWGPGTMPNPEGDGPMGPAALVGIVSMGSRLGVSSMPALSFNLYANTY